MIPCDPLWAESPALLETFASRSCILEAWSPGVLGAWRPGGKDDEAEDGDADE